MLGPAMVALGNGAANGNYNVSGSSFAATSISQRLLRRLLQQPVDVRIIRDLQVSVSGQSWNI